MLCSKDFFKQSTYNHETKEQMWCSAIGDIHDSFCGCEQPFAHFLSCIFPIGHSDRNKTINNILLRDYKQLCRGGGKEETNPGMEGLPEEEKEDGEQPAGGLTKEEPTEEDLALAAAAAVGER